jgi:hypothetical protein
LVVPDPYHLAGLRRGTTASLQQCSGQRLACEWKKGRSEEELVQSLRPRIKATAVRTSGILQNPDVQLAQQVASALVPQPYGTELTLVADLIEVASAQTVQARNNAFAGAGVAALALSALYVLSRAD